MRRRVWKVGRLQVQAWRFKNRIFQKIEIGFGGFQAPKRITNVSKWALKLSESEMLKTAQKPTKSIIFGWKSLKIQRKFRF